MKLILSAASLLFLFSCSSVQKESDSRSSIVDLQSLDTTFVLDIRYATANNFTKTVLYPVAKAKLRREAAESLAAVQRN
ncbi:MAG: hypothetical protein ACOYNS_06890 [Bacteroidota bacterium]